MKFEGWLDIMNSTSAIQYQRRTNKESSNAGLTRRKLPTWRFYTHHSASNKLVLVRRR